jgi:hypothetical protein
MSITVACGAPKLRDSSVRRGQIEPLLNNDDCKCDVLLSYEDVLKAADTADIVMVHRLIEQWAHVHLKHRVVHHTVTGVKTNGGCWISDASSSVDVAFTMIRRASSRKKAKEAAELWEAGSNTPRTRNLYKGKLLKTGRSKLTVRQLAGLFEGEGSISITRSAWIDHTTDKKRVYYILEVAIGNRDVAVLEDIQAACGGRINHRRNDYNILSIRNRIALNFLQELYPCMRSKKAQAAIGIYFQKRIFKGGRFSKQRHWRVFNERCLAQRIMKKLNAAPFGKLPETDLSELSDEEAAGIFDGEGTILLRYSLTGAGSLRVAVDNMDRRLLDPFAEKYDGHVVFVKQSGGFRWIANGNTALDFLKKVYPHIRIKGAQVLLAICAQVEASLGPRYVGRMPGGEHNHIPYEVALRRLNYRSAIVKIRDNCDSILPWFTPMLATDEGI